MKLLFKAVTAVAAFTISSAAISKELVTVSTDDTRMIFLAEKDAPVYFLYWGENVDMKCWQDRYYNSKPDSNEPRACQLYPAFGGSCYLTPALRITHSDGGLVTDLVYDDVRTRTLAPGIEETVIVLKDVKDPIKVEVCFRAYRKTDVIAQSARIVNCGKKPVTVFEAASSFLPLHSTSYYLTHFSGTWAHEMQLSEELLTPGSKIIESKKGVRTSQSESPSFVVSLEDRLHEYSGEVYAGSLAWSGNFRLSFQVDEYGMLGITSGMNPFASEIVLEKGGVLETPEMIMTFSPDGMNRISRNLHDWTREYGLAHGDELRPVLLNSWEGAYFSFGEETITDMIDQASEFGIEMFVLDDGWFGNKFPRNGDNAGLGDWQVNVSKLPHGISYLADYAVSKGLQFGIWIEPEMVNPDSELAHNHPDWIVGSNGRENPTMRNQWLLDLTNPKVQDFVVKTFDDVLAMSGNISYIKWDANRHVENVFSPYLGKDRQPEFWYDYTKALYSVYERIRQAHPQVQIQLCSSGGGRLDYGALKYHDEFWTSDNTNALDRIFIQYGTSFFFPVKAASAHVSTSPNHQTGQMTPIKFRYDVAMTGRLGFELQPSSMSGEEAEFAKNAVRTYKDIRPVVQLGDQYRLISPYDPSGYASEIFVTKDKSSAVFFGYSTKYHGRTEYLTARMRGLDPDKNYLVEELNVWKWPALRERGTVMSGDYLMKAGLNIFIGAPLESIVLRFTEQ